MPVMQRIMQRCRACLAAWLVPQLPEDRLLRECPYCLTATTDEGIAVFEEAGLVYVAGHWHAGGEILGPPAVSVRMPQPFPPADMPLIAQQKAPAV